MENKAHTPSLCWRVLERQDMLDQAAAPHRQVAQAYRDSGEKPPTLLCRLRSRVRGCDR
jgi:hypothetical protein